MLSEELLARRLADRCLSLPFLLYEETGSTNNNAKEFARETPPASPVLFAASRQTAGRGRQGKSFVSVPGGLYLTLLVPLPSLPELAVGVTGCAAVAACRAVEETAGIPARIKWVNDILSVDPSSGVPGKAAGILCEAVGGGEEPLFLVIGIGLNVSRAPVLEEPGQSALPPAALSTPESPVECESLAAALASEFIRMADGGFRFSGVIEDYRRRSAVLGREIRFTRNGISRAGTAESIRDDGALMVRCGEDLLPLDSGEISVRFG